MMQNNYENANANRTEAGVTRAKRTEAELTETLVNERTEGKVAYNHDSRRQHCSFSFKSLQEATERQITELKARL